MKYSANVFSLMCALLGGYFILLFIFFFFFVCVCVCKFEKT